MWITEHPTDVKQVIGSRAILHCKAVGVEDDIKYRWLKSDTKDGKPTKCVSCEPFEWYVIDHLAQKHWGYYFCQAENSFESAVSRKVHVSALLPNEATLSRRTKRMTCGLCACESGTCTNIGLNCRFATTAANQDCEASLESGGPPGWSVSSSL